MFHVLLGYFIEFQEKSLVFFKEILNNEGRFKATLKVLGFDSRSLQVLFVMEFSLRVVYLTLYTGAKMGTDPVRT